MLNKSISSGSTFNNVYVAPQNFHIRSPLFLKLYLHFQVSFPFALFETSFVQFLQSRKENVVTVS